MTVLVSRWAADRPATTPSTTSPRTMMVNSPKRSTSESVGVRPKPTRELRAASTMPTIQATPRPAHTRSRGVAASRALAPSTATETPMPTSPRERLVLGVVPAVLPPDGVPEPGLDDLVGRVHHGEAPAAAVGGVGGEHRQQHEDAHLDEDDAAGPSVLAAVELQVQRSVDPRDPDQGEDNGEGDQPTDRDMLGQVVGRLADDGHIHQVVEQPQDADLPVGDDLAVGSWRPPEPPLEAAMGLAGHGVSRPPRRTSRMLGRPGRARGRQRDDS